MSLFGGKIAGSTLSARTAINTPEIALPSPPTTVPNLAEVLHVTELPVGVYGQEPTTGVGIVLSQPTAIEGQKVTLNLDVPVPFTVSPFPTIPPGQQSNQALEENEVFRPTVAGERGFLGLTGITYPFNVANPSATQNGDMVSISTGYGYNGGNLILQAGGPLYKTQKGGDVWIYGGRALNPSDPPFATRGGGSGGNVFITGGLAIGNNNVDSNPVAGGYTLIKSGDSYNGSAGYLKIESGRSWSNGLGGDISVLCGDTAVSVAGTGLDTAKLTLRGGNTAERSPIYFNNPSFFAVVGGNVLINGGDSTGSVLFPQPVATATPDQITWGYGGNVEITSGKSYSKNTGSVILKTADAVSGDYIYTTSGHIELSTGLVSASQLEDFPENNYPNSPTNKVGEVVIGNLNIPPLGYRASGRHIVVEQYEKPSIAVVGGGAPVSPLVQNKASDTCGVIQNIYPGFTYVLSFRTPYSLTPIVVLTAEISTTAGPNTVWLTQLTTSEFRFRYIGEDGALVHYHVFGKQRLPIFPPTPTV